jgi:accessory gene regulator protein AgrB
MYHKLALKTANACLNRQWISADQFDWCAYAVEKRINYLAMALIIVFIAILTGKIIEIVAFVVSVTALRRRIGGWHAKRTWSCQFLSVIVLLLVISVIGPNIERLDLRIVIAFDTIILLACCITKPIYPPQLYFSDDIIKANNRKKHGILFLMIIIQILSFIVQGPLVMIYSTLGILTSLIALFAQKCTQ